MSTDGVSFHDFSAGGDVGALIHAKDWSTTPLGPRATWPRSLSNYLSMILELPTAAIVFWGPERIQLYNDGYSVIMGPRHPKHLGSPFRDCWPEAYETIDPWMRRVLDHGETVEVNRTLVPLTRYGFTEEAYFTFSFCPLRDDQGAIAGILQLVTEVTHAVLGERRANLLHALSNQAALARTVEDAARLAAEVLTTHPQDLPCCAIYLADSDDRQRLVLCATTALPAGRSIFPSQLDLRAASEAPIPEFFRAIREQTLVTIERFGERMRADASADDWPDRPTLGFVAPVGAPNQQGAVAVLVGSISPRLALDEPLRAFLQLCCAQLAALLNGARAYDAERKRAEALAEIDRTKTEFFNNVSHELRTPLTLILGPMEDALREATGSAPREVLETMHRNALRLLRLVNTLLDFARLESNRLSCAFEPTDLATLTAGLAGSFQSMLSSAGLQLRVDCPPITEPVYVDRAQWEKVVLNLISNAFKFTFAGEIAVALRTLPEHVELSVRDTGTGIPEHELGRIFDRFHRVAGARGRSFEGTGIGLALVRELVAQHGGTVQVTSAVGEGSTFVVRIPRGSGHLPAERVLADSGVGASADGARPFLLEARHWISADETPAQASSATPAADGDPAAAPQPRARVLVVDDNADMRVYLMRLLAPRWQVQLAEDGQAGLEAALRDPPDLILSDVMMPRLDGVGLLRALRAEPATSMVPVVLLSARAGEEAVVGGLETGADDYLVKPFSARELLVRVHTHLEMARLRRKATEAAAELAATRAVLLEDLDRKNRELEAFSYSVSHDLRAPLRAIDGFSQALLEDCAGALDETGRGHLRRVRAAAQRMGELIDDLLELSRVERSELRRVQVCLDEVARAVGKQLAKTDPSRGVALRVEDGLRAEADARLIEILFENLLGNAWKFTSKTRDAHVHVGAAESRGKLAFFVRDNGAGFDTAHTDRLFSPFRRLHTEAEFPGTGIGLATVRRIVERHGGSVWAEGEVDRGATVYFTLPAPSPRSLPA